TDQAFLVAKMEASPHQELTCVKLSTASMFDTGATSNSTYSAFAIFANKKTRVFYRCWRSYDPATIKVGRLIAAMDWRKSATHSAHPSAEVFSKPCQTESTTSACFDRNCGMSQR